MSIATSLTKLETDITSAYNAVQTKGGTIPSDKNTNNLATAINSISGGSATLITKSITQNGTYNASSDNADGYSQVTVNVSGGGTVEPEEKDVNYYDYDGTRLYSYTKNEFLALETEPEVPNRQEMKKCRWNVSFADCQVLVNRDGFLDIGLIGEPADCDIKMFINLSEEFKSPYIYVGASKNCIVDWGDGTIETVTTSETSSTGWINPNHNYSKGGKYVIKITLDTTATTSSNRLYLKASSQTNPYNDSKKTGGLLWGGTSADTSKTNMIYAGCVEEIWLGSRVSKNTTTEAVFSGFTNLKYILNGSSSNIIFHGESIFYNCRNLKAVCLNLQNNRISSYCFKNCYSLKRILGTKLDFSYDDGRGYASSGKAEKVFENCYSLIKNPTFASSYPLLDSTTDYRSTAYLYKGCYSINYLYVTPCSSLSNTCFSDDYPHIKVFDFTSFGSLTNPTVPTLNSTTTFSSGTSDYEIWVPSSLYNDWITASNWSSISSHIVSK